MPTKPPEDVFTNTPEQAREYELWRQREAGELDVPDFDEADADVDIVSDDRSVWDVPPIMLDLDEPDTDLNLVKPHTKPRPSER
jgi:hypothetical protein